MVFNCFLMKFFFNYYVYVAFNQMNFFFIKGQFYSHAYVKYKGDLNARKLTQCILNGR